VDGEKIIVIPMEKGHFKAPRNTGTYYYAYSVGWMDEKDKHLSYGDASYVFPLVQ
jgi:hypothetical protein